jgi:hypothetical protein
LKYYNHLHIFRGFKRNNAGCCFAISDQAVDEQNNDYTLDNSNIIKNLI